VHSGYQVTNLAITGVEAVPPLERLYRQSLALNLMLKEEQTGSYVLVDYESNFRPDTVPDDDL
jgi:hypothetical protein